jgi:hypothetical protein
MFARISAACVLVCGALASLLAVLECQPGASTASASNAVPVPCISFTAAATDQTVPTGTVWNVTAHVGVPASNEPNACPSTPSVAAQLPPIDGLLLTFGVTATGATISPTSNVTDVNGLASASVVVPFDTEVAVTVSGGGGEAVSLVPPTGGSTPGVTLTPTFQQTSTWLPGGELFELDVKASSAGNSGPPQIAGFSVSFATTTTGIAFSPAMVMTDDTGLARSYVVIPYGAQIQAVVSGGGVIKQLPQSAPPLTLATTSGLLATNTAIAGGQVYGLTVQATPADRTMGSGGVAGVPLAFATTTTGVAFSPASVTTDPSGNATSVVLVPYGTQIEAVVSGGGNVITFPVADAGAGVSAPVVDLTLDSFGPVQPPVYVASGQAYTIKIKAKVHEDAGTGPAVEGLSISFASTTGATFSPATVATDTNGVAMSTVIVPYGTPLTAIITGGGTVFTLPSGDAGLVVGPVVTLDASLGIPPDAGVGESSLPCTLTGTAQVGDASIVGLPLTFAITAIQAGGSVAIAGPGSPILTTDGGSASYTVLVPPTVLHFTAVVSGGGAVATTNYPPSDD